MDRNFLEQRAGLEGKTILVLGGAGGLGRACVEDLGRSGATLVVCDRDAPSLEAISEWAHDADIRLRATEGDVRNASVLDRVFAELDQEFGRLDVLINVVGGTFHQPFEASTAKGWDVLIRTNFTWLLTSTQMAIPRMRSAGGGSIINLTSIEAHRAAPKFCRLCGHESGRGELQPEPRGRDGTRWNPDQLYCGGPRSDRATSGDRPSLRAAFHRSGGNRHSHGSVGYLCRYRWVRHVSCVGSLRVRDRHDIASRRRRSCRVGMVELARGRMVESPSRVGSAAPRKRRALSHSYWMQALPNSSMNAVCSAGVCVSARTIIHVTPASA